MTDKDTLMNLIDTYAETRHRCGGIYNAKTEAARKAVIEALSGVQALSAAPANPLTISPLEEQQMFDDWCPYRGNPDPRTVWAAAIEAVNGMQLCAASPTPPAEQQAITPETGNSASAQGAAITSESGAVYAELPDFDSGDEPIWEAVFNWKAATPGSDAHKKADAVSGAVINALRDFADRTHALRMEQAASKVAPESFLDGADVQDESGVLAYYSREAVLACITAALESVAAPKAAPVVWLSSKQLRGVTALHGQYLPFRCQPEGRFDTPVYLVEAAPKAAPGDVLDEALRERDEAEDFINELLDEVLGADRPEWSSAYNRYDAMSDVRERITALHKPAVDKAWGQFQSAKAAPQQEAQAEKVQAITDLAATYASVCINNPERKHTCWLNLKKRVAEILAAPQPAPAPLSDDVVKDAARYAALRDGSIEHDDILTNGKDPGKWEQPYAVLLRGIELDSAIDAALAAQGGK